MLPLESINMVRHLYGHSGTEAGDDKAHYLFRYLHDFNPRGIELNNLGLQITNTLTLYACICQNSPKQIVKCRFD